MVAFSFCELLTQTSYDVEEKKKKLGGVWIQKKRARFKSRREEKKFAYVGKTSSFRNYHKAGIFIQHLSAVVLQWTHVNIQR